MDMDSTPAILLADDDELYRSMMSSMLNSLGFYNIVEASNGIQAFRLGCEYKPLFAFVDIYMPGMNGWEVVQQFKKELPDTILVMVTGSKGRKDVDAAFSNGVDGYFFKPCDRDLVKKTMTELVSLKKKLKKR